MAKTNNLTSDGSTPELRIEGKVNIAVYGDFGSGTLTFQLSYDGGSTWIPATESQGQEYSLLTPESFIIETGRALFRATLQQSQDANLFVSVSGIEPNSKWYLG